MAGPSPLLLVAGVGALLFLMKSGEDEDEPKPLPDVEPKPGDPDEDEPPPKEDEPPPKEDEPPPKEDEPPPDDIIEDEEVPAQEAFDALSFKRKDGKAEKVTVDDIPEGFDHASLFISEDCSVFIIGRDWKPFVLANNTPYSPEAWYLEFGNGKRPTDQGAAQMDVSVVLDYADRLFSDKNCYEKIPNKRNYQVREEYDNAFTHFLNSEPSLRDGFFEVYYERVTPPMMDAWADVDPEGYEQYAIEHMVDEVFKDYPTLDDVDDLTEIAYERLTKEDPDAPALIDPQNPDHEEYEQLWLAIRDAVAKHA